MTALSLRQIGIQRMSDGGVTFLRALVDAGRGLYAMLSGVCLFLAGVVLTPWMWISGPFMRPAPAQPGDARRWQRFVTVCRRLGAAAGKWAVFALVAVPLSIGLAVVLNHMDAPLREALTNASNIIYPIAFFLALAVLYGVGWLIVQLGAALLGYLAGRLTRQGRNALALVMVVTVAGVIGAVLYAILKPAVFIALIAGVAVLAGVAGFALIAFGPSGVALFHVGTWGCAPAGPARRSSRTPAGAIKSRNPQSARIMHQSVMSAPVLGAAPIVMAPPEQRGGKETGKRWSMPQISVDPTGVLIALAVVVALLLAWGGGELLTRAFPGSPKASLAPVEPAPPPAMSRANAASGAGAATVLQLLADGETADVSWRSGYRQLTVRLDDGGAVRQLSLPSAACRTGAIVAFGAASSDGSPTRNTRLAERRARWLAEWTREELAQCPNPAPAVIAVTLGQAKPGLPLPAQRAVRLLAIRDEDMRNPAFTTDPNFLREKAQAALTGLDAFDRFDACVLAAQEEGGMAPGWLRPCETPPQ